MYTQLKKYAKTVIPHKFLFKNEPFFRFFHGIFYLGNKHQCNVCNKKLNKFIELGNSDLLCPFCGSLSRNRRLWYILNNKHHLKGNILHFSPSRSLYRNLKKIKNIHYVSSDFEDEFLADYNLDITNIEQPDNTFQTIICYHILEHIIEDTKAMRELYRVLKPNGFIYIQTPFKDGTIYEDSSITSPKDRLKHFGQEDHVRIYSVQGLKQRLENVGFKTTINTFQTQKEDVYYGLKSPETVLVASK